MEIIAAIFLIITIIAIGGLLVFVALLFAGFIATAINEAHAWEEWRQERPDDRKGKENQDNAKL